MKIRFPFSFFILIFIFECTGINAQSFEHLSNARLFKMAEEAFRESDFETAIGCYEEYLTRKPSSMKAGFALASTYQKVRDYENAMKWYKLLYEQDTQRNILALLSFGRVAMASGDVNLAKRSFERFKREFDPGKDKNYIKKLNGYHLLGVSLFEAEFDSLKVKYQKTYDLDKIYNHPFIVGNRLTFFEADNEQLNMDEKKILDLLNSHSHIPESFFSPGIEQFFFSKYEKNEKGEYVASIYQCKKKDGVWDAFQKLPNPINLEEYNSLLPTVGLNSKNGELVIYFVSDRPGGKGGWDIWYTEFNSRKNAFREPKNVGSKINTAANEFSPFYDVEEGVLYFSSDGWPGFGGYDIFWSKGEGRSWEDYFNLGTEINTNYDEYYFTRHYNLYYWASNRIEKTGRLAPHYYDDFFMASSITRIREESLTALNKKSKEEKPSIKVETDTVYQKTEIEDVSIENERYNIEQVTDSIIKVTLYHEFDEAELIDKFLRIIDEYIVAKSQGLGLKEINIISYTDNKGTEAYNKVLSTARAKFVNDYLLSKGIDQSIIQYKGKGETEPVVPNENTDGTDNPEGRRLNRRTIIEAEVN